MVFQTSVRLNSTLWNDSRQNLSCRKNISKLFWSLNTTYNHTRKLTLKVSGSSTCTLWRVNFLNLRKNSHNCPKKWRKGWCRIFLWATKTNWFPPKKQRLNSLSKWQWVWITMIWSVSPRWWRSLLWPFTLTISI